MSYNVIAIVCMGISETLNTLFLFMTYSDDTLALYHAVPVLDLCICAFVHQVGKKDCHQNRTL
jgi:hypothetical protein